MYVFRTNKLTARKSAVLGSERMFFGISGVLIEFTWCSFGAKAIQITQHKKERLSQYPFSAAQPTPANSLDQKAIHVNFSQKTHLKHP
jgi:hypothetical protein